VILAESSLNFLGFGVPVPLSSWGNMLGLSQDLFRPLRDGVDPTTR